MTTRPLRDVVRHTLVYGLGSVGTSLISFVLIPVYTRYLTPAEYGVLALVLLFQAVSARFYDLGLTNSVGRFFFDYQDDPDASGLRRMASTTVFFHIAFGGLLSTLIFFGAPWIMEALAPGAGDATLVRIVSVTLFLDAVSITPLTLLRMEERSGLWVTITTLRVAGALALNILFVVGLGLGVAGVLLSSAIGSAGVLAALSGQLRRRTARVFDRDVLAKMLSFGLPFLPVLLGVLVIDLSDRFLLDRLRSTTEVGIYSLGYRFGQVMMIAVSAFSMGWAPLRYRIFPRPDARELYSRIAALYWVAAMLGTVALAVLGDEVVRLAATEPFFAASSVIPAVASAYALYGLSLITTTGMGVTKRTAGQGWTVGACAVLNVGLNLLWIPRWGMLGAAWATVVTYAFIVAGTHWFSQRVYPLRLPWSRMSLLAALALCAVYCDHLLQGGSSGIVRNIAVGVGILAVFTSAIPLTGLVRRSEVVAAWAWVKGLTRREAVG